MVPSSLSECPRWFLASGLLLGLACGGPGVGELRVVLQGPPERMPPPGQRVVLRARATLGNLPAEEQELRFRWSRDGEPLAGAQGPSLVLDPVARGDAGAYRVEVARGSAFATSGPVFLEPVDRVWVVTGEGDSGPGTLRDTLATAQAFGGLNGIRFALPAASRGVIRLAGELPPVRGRVCILGPSEPPLTLDGGGRCRPLAVDGGTLLLTHFTVANGLAKGGDAPGGGGAAAGMGGGLFINGGEVILRSMTFRGNGAQGGSSGEGGDGENGGGAGFGGDSPAQGGAGADGGWLGGKGGLGHLDGTATTDAGGGPALDGDGAGGGAARGGLPGDPLETWADNLPGGAGTFGGGGGFSVGPAGGGGDGSSFGGGGGGAGGRLPAFILPGAGGGAGGVFGGDGVPGNGLTGGRGGGGGGMGGAVFFRAGSLALVQCSFLANTALGGEGGNAGLGKGGAVFVYAYRGEGAPAALPLAMLQAQTYRGNRASDLVEDAAFDNDDYYVAQTLLALRPGSALDLRYRLYRLDRSLGLPWPGR